MLDSWDRDEERLAGDAGFSQYTHRNNSINH